MAGKTPLSNNDSTEKSIKTLVPALATPPHAWVAAILLAIPIGLVYGPFIQVPFIFDDVVGITGNESIFSLWPLFGSNEHPGPLNPAQDIPLSGRPLVNLSLAVNYHFGGLDPTGYHVVSVIIHYLSALFVWMILRRALLLPYFGHRFDTSAGWLALVVALIWSLHPLQTEAVIYATQRTELMMAFFYLTTLYCSLRYFTLPHVNRNGPTEGSASTTSNSQLRAVWLTLAVFACLAGMASKEVMVSAPLIVLLFDRAFVSGSFTKALRHSWPLYAGLASTWILLLLFNIGAPHQRSAGFGSSVNAVVWWLTQSKVLLLYLKLTVWPWPLLIHYQWPFLNTFSEAWMYVVPVLFLGISTLVLLSRNSPVGFLATWVFAVLAPTSVVPIVTELAAERRMYLPLVALTILFVVGGYRITQILLHRLAHNWRPSVVVTALPLILLVFIYGLVSAERLATFNDEMELWQEVVHHQPENAFAHGSLGALMLAKPGQVSNAIDELRTALKWKPDYPEALNNVGVALTHIGRTSEAIEALSAALRLQPDYLDALNNLGLALINSGRFSQAIENLEHAVTVRPTFADGHNTLGIALYRSGQIPKAIGHFRQALQLNPNQADAHSNLGLLLASTGAIEEATSHLEQAVHLLPNRADFQKNFADLLRQSGKLTWAIEHYQAALQLEPNDPSTYANLAQALAQVDQSAAAVAAAKKGIEVGIVTDHKVVAEQLEDWLKHYQIELRRTAKAASPAEQQPPRP